MRRTIVANEAVRSGVHWLVNERRILLERARAVIALGLALCLVAVAVVAIPRQLGMIGNVYVYEDYWSNGTYLWVGTRGLAWLVLGGALALIGLPVTALGIREYLRERRTDVPVARALPNP